MIGLYTVYDRTIHHPSGLVGGEADARGRGLLPSVRCSYSTR
jgi:hypothetical protein